MITADSSSFSTLFDGIYGALHSWAVFSVSIPCGVFSSEPIPKAELRKSSPGHSYCFAWYRHAVSLGVQYHVNSSSVPLAQLSSVVVTCTGCLCPAFRSRAGECCLPDKLSVIRSFSLACSSGPGLRLNLMVKDYSST